MGWFNNKWFFFDKQKNVHESFYLGKNSKYNYNPSDTTYPIEKGFANTLDVYSIISRIVQKAKEIPVQLVVGPDEKIVTRGKLFDILNKPSKATSRDEFFELGMTFLLSSGNAIAYLNAPIGFNADDLTLLYPQNITVNTTEREKQIIPLSYEYNIGTKNYESILAENISHIKNVNPTEYGLDNYWGLSPIQAAYLSVISVQNLDTANASILENRGAIGILSNESEIVLSPEEADKHQKRLDARMGGATDFNKIIQSGAKVKYQPIGLSPADLKIIESRVMKLRDLCNAFSADSSLFNDPQNKTFSNRKDANKALYTDAVIPTLNKFLNIFEPIVKAQSKKDGKKYKIKVDLSNIPALQQDRKEKSIQAKNISSAIITILASNSTREQKIETLVESLEISQERASKIVGNAKQPQQESQ
jgi:HK97 family phage portal protein